MGGAVPYDGLDGVVGAWYGKGPGLDRCGDVLKHANMMGTGPGGGAVLFVGDDPSAKSSTLPYDTNLALADASVPVLVPADQQDLFDLGLAAFGLSRFCGSWVGLRIVTAVADGIGTVDTGVDRFPVARPTPRCGWTGSGGATSRSAASSAATSRSCGSTAGSGPPRAGSPPAGSTGWSAPPAAPGSASCAPARPTATCSAPWRRAASASTTWPAAGVRILKLAMTYPIAPDRLLELSGSVDEILVVEEKRPFVEQQVRADAPRGRAHDPGAGQARRRRRAAGADHRRADRRPPGRRC